jgi:hypothetical protein
MSQKINPQNLMHPSLVKINQKSFNEKTIYKLLLTLSSKLFKITK